jgi:hypothetical protein
MGTVIREEVSVTDITATRRIREIMETGITIDHGN